VSVIVNVLEELPQPLSTASASWAISNPVFSGIKAVLMNAISTVAVIVVIVFILYLF
jgi:hypothetical protein